MSVIFLSSLLVIFVHLRWHFAFWFVERVVQHFAVTVFLIDRLFIKFLFNLISNRWHILSKWIFLSFVILRVDLRVVVWVVFFFIEVHLLVRISVAHL